MSQQRSGVDHFREVMTMLADVANRPGPEVLAWVINDVAKIASLRNQHIGAVDIDFNATPLLMGDFEARKRHMDEIRHRIQDAFDPGTAVVVDTSLSGFVALALLPQPASFPGHVKQVAQSLADLYDDVPLKSRIGGAIRPLAEKPGEQLLKQAAIARLMAGDPGQDGWSVFDPESHREKEEDMRLISEMSQALKDGQFQLHFQPIVERNHHWWGSEALTRWNHPELGPIRPDRFIRLAEQSGFIHKLGKWTTRTACEEATRLYREMGGGSPVVSVNVCGAQLENSDYVRYVEELLRELDLPPHKLQLELLETAEVNPDVIKELAAMGVLLAVDDFGTERSNYARVRQLTRLIKEAGSDHKLNVKLDRIFLEEDLLDILPGVVGFLDSQGATKTIEGIENDEQLDMAVGLGIDKCQGYGPGRPVPGLKPPSQPVRPPGRKTAASRQHVAPQRTTTRPGM